MPSLLRIPQSISGKMPATISFVSWIERLYANDVAYYFAKTDEGKALRNEVNVVLSEMLEDGTVAKIVEKYMYSDMTKNIIPYSELGFTVE